MKMAKSTRVLVILAVFGAVSTFVHGSSYIPRGSWPYSMYTTTQTPPEFTSTTTTTTPSPFSQLDNENNKLEQRFVIIRDPKTGTIVYIPSDLFWQKFGNSIREKRSATWRSSRAFEMKEPMIHLGEEPQIDDVIENDEYDKKYSDYLRSASQNQPQVYYDDNIADSAEDQHVQIQINHKDTPTWQPSDVFKAFFPNYRYNPNKIVYTYSSICSNGCVNNKKFYNPPADNIVLSSSTVQTPTTTEASTTTTTTTTSEQPIFEDSETTVNTIEPETETTTGSQSLDYIDPQGSQVPPS
jgi:hypothetical protein